MEKDNFNIDLLNKSLIIFFIDALKVAIKNPSQAFVFFRTLIWLVKASIKRKKFKRQGIHIPPIIIFSITNKCNLQCNGCYSLAFYGSSDKEMSDEKVRNIIKEAKEVGISFFVIAGGEPLIRKEILNITKDFPKMIFLLFTNGLLIDDYVIEKLKQQKNVVPLISLEGYKDETDERRGAGVYENLQEIIKKLHKQNVFFGASLTLTRPTFGTLTSIPYIQTLFNAGNRFFLFIEYTSIKEGTGNLVLTLEQRNKLMDLIKSFRSKFPALFIGVPGDEIAVGGCLAAGRGFVHINAEGNVEPCPFAPFSDANVKESSLKDALQSKFLKTIREHPELLNPTEGGCSLWKKRELVISLINKNEPFVKDISNKQ